MDFNTLLMEHTFLHGQIRYVEDDSTIFWAVGPGSGALAKRADCCGKEVDLVVPFEGRHGGEVI